MADKKYIDADGCFSRYLQMSDLGSHLLCASSGSEARHHKAAPPADFLSLTIGSPHYQATIARPPEMMPIPAQDAHGFCYATLVQGSGGGGSSWIKGMLACHVVHRPSLSLSLHDQIITARKEITTNISSIYCHIHFCYMYIYSFVLYSLGHCMVSLTLDSNCGLFIPAIQTLHGSPCSDYS